MRPEGLRIGDLITIDNPISWPNLKDIPLKVTGICTNSKDEYFVNCEHIDKLPNTFYENYSQFIEFIKPIPLTTKWLIRLGFRRSKQYKWYEHGNPYLIISKKYEAYLEYPNVKVKLYHVHQLQNLFFALIGEQLKIK